MRTKGGRAQTKIHNWGYIKGPTDLPKSEGSWQKIGCGFMVYTAWRCLEEWTYKLLWLCPEAERRMRMHLLTINKD